MNLWLGQFGFRSRSYLVRAIGRFQFLIVVALLFSEASVLAQFKFLEGIHAYNPARDKVAQTALGTLTNLNLLQLTAGNETNLESLEAQELDLQNKQNGILRDLKVYAMCTDPKKPADVVLFQGEIENRLVEIFGGSADNALKLARAHQGDSAQLKVIISALNVKANAFEAVFGARPPSFAFATTLPGTPPADLAKFRTSTNQARFDEFYGDYAAMYNSLPFNDLGAGVLAGTFASLNNAVVERANLESEASDVNKTLASASSNIDAALKAGEADKTSEVIQKVTNTLATIDLVIEKAQNSSNPLAQKIALEAQLDAIDEVIAAAISGQASTNLAKAAPGTKRAALIAAQLPALTEAATTVEKSLEMPKVSALLIQRELLSIQLDGVNQQIDLLNQRVDTLQKKYLAILLEVQMLQEIGQERTTLLTVETNLPPLNSDWEKMATNRGVSLPNGLLNLPVPILLASNAPKEVRRPVIAAVLKLAISIRVARLREDDADLQLIHLDYLAANSANQESVRMWNALISTPVNEIASYYAAGFKPAEVADILVKGLGLGAIAWRVH